MSTGVMKTAETVKAAQYVVGVLYPQALAEIERLQEKVAHYERTSLAEHALTQAEDLGINLAPLMPGAETKEAQVAALAESEDLGRIVDHMKLASTGLRLGIVADADTADGSARERFRAGLGG